MVKRKVPTPPVTKLAPPRSQSALLARPRVLAALCGLTRAKLAVVTAPTGAGKSTLMAQAHVALAQQGMDVGWLSLDAGDDGARRFVAHLIAAIAQARPGTGGDALDLLGSPAVIEDVLAALINDLTAREAPLAIFLDDYQVITDAEVHAALAYLLQYSPASVRFAIASQAELPLSLARLRARDAVIALGFDDLRFDGGETRDYLAQCARLSLSEGEVARLAEETEGWACGLQLATLAPDVRAAATGGGAGAYADALLEEVFSRQPPDVQAFLLATAVLAQFSAPLAEAVTGVPEAMKMIERLERANLFVIRLDATREWFRYHHLFSAFLKKRLARGGEAAAATLQQRAARWCAAHGQQPEALAYALAAGDTAFAATVQESYGRALIRSGDFKELTERMAALPAAVVHASAALCVQEAWAQLYIGEPVAAGIAIRAAEAALARHPVPRLAAELRIQRTMHGVTRYDLPEVEGLTEDLPDAFGPEDALPRAYAHVVLGYAARLAGRLPAALHHYEEAIAISGLSEDIVVNLMARYNVAMVHVLEARPDLAAEGLTAWIRDARNKRWQRSGSAAFLKAAHAIALIDMDRMAEARAEIGEAIEVLDATRTYAYVGIALALRAQAAAALGEGPQAQSDLQRAREIGHAQRLDRVIFRAALTGARIACATGDTPGARAQLAEAHAILEATGQTRMAPPSENHALYDGALAACLAAEERHADLATLAERMRAQALAAGRVRFEIEALVWLAVARAALGDREAAIAHAGRAIDLASPAGVIHPFVAAGPAVLPLIAPHREGGLRTTFAARVAASLTRESEAPRPTRRTPALHQREVQILQLLGQGLRNREIGERLLISEETVKWYLKRIYEALGVGNRTHALVRARDEGFM